LAAAEERATIRPEMRTLPSGTVTLLMTDIEGSTRLLQELGEERFNEALSEHRRALREAFATHNGVELRTEGDSFFAAFASAREAVAAAAQAQRALAPIPLQIRIGIHTGEPLPVEHEDGYVGVDVHRAARICGAGHGGQVLLSQATRDLLGAGLELRDLGRHRLKDLPEPERLYQLGAGRFPPPKSLNQSDLPAQPTRFVGRKRELEEVLVLLRRGDVRLLTLTGVGGTGKTRLAVQAAAELVEQVPDGVSFVALAPLRAPELVLPTIAQTLGLKETAAQPLAETLRDYLRERQLLLVLDNFEQLLPAAPGLAELVGAAPGLQLLVTSRAPLHLAAEQVYPVPPLAVPDPSKAADLDALVRSDAVALFLARAQAANPRFELTAENASAIATLCLRLDGLPLAIELAAARTTILPPAALVQRLGQRLALLTGGARDLPDRQQTLRGTIDWSYRLLDEPKQRLFARLAVFVGGCTLEAAEAVCNSDGEPGPGILEELTALVEQSLLRQTEGPQEEPRFSMLETIREYALELPNRSGEAKEMQRAHARFYLALAERAEAELTGPRQSFWMATLEADHENFRCALEWSLEQDEFLYIARFGGSLWRFWNARGHLTEGRAWLRAALERRDELSTGVRVRVLTAAGVLAQNQEDYADAVGLYEESLALCRGLGDLHGVARALHNLGITAMYERRYSDARAFFEESLALFRAEGNRWRVATSLGGLGTVALGEGDCEAAAALQAESLALRRELGDQRGVVISLYNLTEVVLAQGNDAAAVPWAEECLALARELGDKWGIAYALGDLALLALRRGDDDRAAGLYAETLSRWKELGRREGIADCFEGLAGVARVRGRPRRAAHLLGAASAAREELGISPNAFERSRFEQAVKDVRAELDESNFAEAWESGRESSGAHAIQYAFDEESAFVVA
jgi:predicted ATPase/class 3 adenylate cyclase